MLLLSSPRSGRLHRASVLPLVAAVLLCLFPVSRSFPVATTCRHECFKLRRHTCPFGSSKCGPCYNFFVEDKHGFCILPHSQRGKVTSHAGVYADLDEEIDYLDSVIAQKLVKPPKEQPKHPVSVSFQAEVSDRKTQSSKVSQRNQGRIANLGLFSTTATPPPPTSGPPNPSTTKPAASGRAGPIAVPAPSNDKITILIISLCVVVGSVAVILATVCVVKLQRKSRLAEKVDYPAFKGADAPAPTANGTSMGDKTLATSAQMFHYQHQKQQMISMGNQKPEQKIHDTDVTSDEEEVGGDFTVYECPGLAPTGEMEVKNPLFDDSTLPYQENPK